jgi:hypothetical protein
LERSLECSENALVKEDDVLFGERLAPPLVVAIVADVWLFSVFWILARFDEEEGSGEAIEVAVSDDVVVVVAAAAAAAVVVAVVAAALTMVLVVLVSAFPLLLLLS